MGGGDLNLKKSWHPSTMKNMEKVWKAEQQDHQEKKRIAELKREIEMEKDKEDMTKYAMDQGVIEKKDDKKLDWMYKGPNQAVNREDYLLGKPIDKPFEKMVQAEKDGELNRVPKNHVEYECIPPSLRFFSGTEQVDLARKLQEDPLYAIKKKEMETKSQLLKNPVRLKQLRDLLDEQSKRGKGEKKNKKKRKKKRSKSGSSEEDSDGDLDNLLAKKYKKLKNKINEDYLIKSMKRLRKEKNKKAKAKSSDSSNSNDSSNSSESDSGHEQSERKERNQRLKHRKNSIGEEREIRKKECKKKQSDRSPSKERARSSRQRSSKKRKSSDTSSSDHEDDSNDQKKRRKHKDRESHDLSKTNYRNHAQDRKDKRGSSPRRGHESAPRNTREADEERKPSKKVDFGLMRADRTRLETVNRPESKTAERKKEEKRWVPPKKQRLTEEEKEQRRREMMENASWRDREREVNVKRYREQEKKEQSDKTYSKDFIRKQLAVAAEVGTIESRIRANINNIQRSGRAMDTNFAKR